MHIAKLFLALALTSFSISATAQSKFIVIDKTYENTSDEVKKKLKQQGYKPSTIITNDYVIVKKGKQQRLSDKEGNLVAGDYDFVTYKTKQNTFFTGTAYYSPNDYGKSEVSEIRNIKTRNLQGQEIQAEIHKHANYIFAKNQASSSKFYSSSSNDYVTIQQLVEEPNEKGVVRKVYKEGIIDASGTIVLEPKYKRIRQVYEDYFLVYEGKVGKIMNLTDLSADPTPVDDIANYPKAAKRFNEVLVFNSLMIMKSEGKYGIYDLDNKNWVIANTYDDLQPISKSIQPDGNPSSKFRRVLYTDAFIAQKAGEWGVITLTNETVVPFQFAKIDYLRDSIYTVFNAANKKNRYDIRTQKEVFPNYYDDYILNAADTDIAIFKDDGNYGVFDLAASTFLIDPAEGYVKYKNYNKGKQYILLKPNPKAERQSEKFFHTIFAVKTRKIIGMDFKEVKQVAYHNSLLDVKDFDNLRSIINHEGEVVITPTQLKGKATYSKSKQRLIFKSAGKKQTLYFCYDLEGKSLPLKQCK